LAQEGLLRLEFGETRSLPVAAANSVARAIAPSANVGWASRAACNLSTRPTWLPGLSQASRLRLAPMSTLALANSLNSRSTALVSSARTARATAPNSWSPDLSGSEMTRLCSVLASRTVGATTTGRARCTAACAAADSDGVNVPRAGHSATMSGKP
jgi:hypothetical protein